MDDKHPATADYLSGTMTVSEINTKHDLSPGTLYRILRKDGVKPGRLETVVPEIAMKVMEKHAKGFRKIVIARELGLTRQKVDYIIRMMLNTQ